MEITPYSSRTENVRPKMTRSGSSKQQSEGQLESSPIENLSKPTQIVQQDEEVQRPEEEEEEEEDVEENKSSSPPYSAFSKYKRIEVLLLVTLAGFVSPMTANIILPALPSIAKSLPVSLESANLTVTVYMIFQAFTPIFLGSLTDIVGRRPIYLLCFILYEGANAGLANLPNSYVGFLLLRMLQAAGAASTVSIGAGSIADIAPIHQRGVWMGVFAGGATIGPSLGPVLGAIFDQAWGWRSIFWFCFIVGGVCLVAFLFLLPETLRLLVGNGSQPAPTLLHEALLDLMMGRTVAQKTKSKRPGLHAKRSSSTASDQYSSSTNQSNLAYIFTCIISPIRLLFYPQTFALLVVNAIPYAAYYCVSSTLSDLFQSKYHLTTLQAGLVFLSPGVGMMAGSYGIGLILDHDYRYYHIERKTSLVYARMIRYPIYCFLTFAPLIAYGWCVQYNVYMAVPIIMFFIFALGTGSVASMVQVMLVDQHPGKSASVTGCNNLVRCISGAIGTAVIEYVLQAIHPGWTFTIAAFIVLLAALPAFVVYRLGSIKR